MSRLERVARSRRVVLEAVTEKGWQATVVEIAEGFGWWTYHPYDSRRSAPGWVDLTMIRPPRVAFAELKTERGRVSPAQREVRSLLELCPGVEVYLWRPSDRDDVERVLR